MVGPAQLGVLAACVVLFVPMGMAGWHLSRNKMLFFSGALFITLAVGVHLAPFFPSASRFLLSSLSAPPPDHSSSCLPYLHDIAFTPAGAAGLSWSWSWSRSGAAAACGFQRLSRSDASDLLNGSWVLVAGDSQARLLVLALLRLVLDPADMEAVEADLFRRHSNYQIVIAEHGIKVDFVWAPYETNLTSGVLRELAFGRHFPDVLVVGSGLWHMLHFSNASEYGDSLVALRRSASALRSPGALLDGLVASQPIHMFWLGLPTLVNSMLNTEEKREKMNRKTWEAYNREVNESKILRRSGGPLFSLDAGLLSQRCGRHCTDDGMHYNGVVYEAGLHIMLNALLIESQQRIEGGN